MPSQIHGHRHKYYDAATTAGAERTLIGYDCDQKKIECATRVVRDTDAIRFVCDDGYRADAPYDTIIISDVLCFVKDKETLMSDLLKLLKPGGMFIVKDIAQNGGLGFCWTYFQDFMAKNVLRITAAHGLYYVRSEEMETIFKQCALSEIVATDESSGYVYPHFLVVGKK